MKDITDTLEQIKGLEGPLDESNDEEDNDKSTKSQSKTGTENESKTSTENQSKTSTSTSTSSCTNTATVSDCRVACPSQAASGKTTYSQSCSTTCFSTLTGCSVTGATSTTFSGGACALPTGAMAEPNGPFQTAWWDYGLSCAGNCGGFIAAPSTSIEEAISTSYKPGQTSIDDKGAASASGSASRTSKGTAGTAPPTTLVTSTKASASSPTTSSSVSADCSNPSLEDGDGLCTCHAGSATTVVTPDGGPGNTCPETIPGFPPQSTKTSMSPTANDSPTPQSKGPSSPSPSKVLSCMPAALPMPYVAQSAAATKITDFCSSLGQETSAGCNSGLILGSKSCDSTVETTDSSNKYYFDTTQMELSVHFVRGDKFAVQQPDCNDAFNQVLNGCAPFDAPQGQPLRKYGGNVTVEDGKGGAAAFRIDVKPKEIGTRT